MVSGEKPSDLTNRHLSSFKQLVISFSKQNKTKQSKTKKKRASSDWKKFNKQKSFYQNSSNYII